jgi:protein TonB
MGFNNPADYEILEREAQRRATHTAGNGTGPASSSADFGSPSLTYSGTNPAEVEHNEILGRGRQYRSPARAEGPAFREDGNTLMTQPDTEGSSAASGIEGHELDSFLGKAFEEKPIWTGLYESVHDLFFPPKLPPLELTSTPIPVPDRMAVKTNPWAVGTATVVNGGILALILFMGARTIIQHITQAQQVTPIDVGEFKVDAPKSQQQAGGGGGGGDHSLVDPIKGKLPKLDKAPVVPPMVPILDKPKLAVDSAIAVQQDIKLPDNPNLPMIGVHSSANVTLASNGQGTGGGMGTGSGGGLGSGTGNGYGPGTGGNTGGGVERVGGLVSAPVPLLTPEAEFSDEARRAKYQGEVMITLIVDAQGNPINPRVVRPLGMGLDEKALEAVRKYKFKPAMKQGKPVPVIITIAVNFRLY